MYATKLYVAFVHTVWLKFVEQPVFRPLVWVEDDVQ
jgi:hypothetical protein